MISPVKFYCLREQKHPRKVFGSCHSKKDATNPYLKSPLIFVEYKNDMIEEISIISIFR